MNNVLNLKPLAPAQVDVAAKHGVEITVRQDGLVTWINCDGICVMRIITNGMIPIDIVDNRKQK